MVQRTMDRAGAMTVVVSFTQVQTEQAERLLSYYRDGLASRDETRNALMTAFRLEAAEVEIMLNELDNDD